MRPIKKATEPASLTQHRLSPHSDYDNYQDKDALRESLVAEQRGLCCYCLKRIRPIAGEMKIAHWNSRANHPDEQLRYENLLGACTGGEGQSPARQHCDTRQGERDLSKNPANPQHQIEHLVHFVGDGRITSNDLNLDAELNDVLNLNVPLLRNNRKAVLAGFQKRLKQGNLSRSQLQRWLCEWNGEADNSSLREYCQVVVYWLRKRLARE